MPTDPNHRAMLRAVDGLTTQVRRIADTLATPVTTDDDGAQATSDDTPAWTLCTCGDKPVTAQHPEPCPLSREPHASRLAEMHGTPWPAMPYKMCSASASSSTEGAFAQLLGPCILRYQHYSPVHQDADGGSWAVSGEAPTTRGAEKQRTIRRQQFRILLNQLNDGTTPLTPQQAQALTAYVADEIVECNMETKEADRLEGDVKLLRAELDRIYTRRAPGGEGYVSLTIDEQIAMGAKLEEATTTLRRVRHLHARTTIQTATGGPVDVCATCESDAMSHPWPCPTTEALAGPTTDR